MQHPLYDTHPILYNMKLNKAVYRMFEHMHRVLNVD